MRVAWYSFSRPGAKEGLDGDKAAGDVFERIRRLFGDGALMTRESRDGVFGNNENAGLFPG